MVASRLSNGRHSPSANGPPGRRRAQGGGGGVEREFGLMSQAAEGTTKSDRKSGAK